MADGGAGSLTERAGVRAGPFSPRWPWAGRALSALDPLRLAGAALFLAFWEAASLFVSPIILPGPLGVFERAATDFWSAPALSYFGLEDASLAGNLLYTTENVAHRRAARHSDRRRARPSIRADSGSCARRWTR